MVLGVADLPACIAALKHAGVTFRNELEVGPGGRQIQIEDADRGTPSNCSSRHLVREERRFRYLSLRTEEQRHVPRSSERSELCKNCVRSPRNR